jgi:hypothetical protein
LYQSKFIEKGKLLRSKTTKIRNLNHGITQEANR